MMDKLAVRLSELRAHLRDANPLDVGARSGAEQGSKPGSLRLFFFSRSILISFPDLVSVEEQTGLPLPELHQALLLYYLSTADGVPLEGRWFSFADRPGGRFYNQAFQGYSGTEIAKHFGDDLTAFERSGGNLGGTRLSFGDAASPLLLHRLEAVRKAVRL